MAQNLDLSLPATAPAAYIAQFQHTGILPAALYTLVSLSEDDLQEVARACDPDSDPEDNDVVRPAPESSFVSQPLRAVYNSHVQLAEQDEFDPYYFIVVVDKDWKKNGVLLVTLYNDDEPPAIDSFFCKAENAGSIVQNLQIANSDWEEVRENYEIGVDGGDDDDNDDDEGDDGDDKEQEERPTDAEEGQSDDEGPDYPSKKPSYDYLIPIYMLDAVDTDTIVSALEEDVDEKPNPSNDYRIRAQASLRTKHSSGKDIKALNRPDPLITEDLIAQASILHPVRCRANKWLNKTYFLVCDNTEPSKSGLVLVKLAWDGVTTGRSKDELREIGRTASHQLVRLAGTSDNAIKYGYTMIAEGSAVLSRSHTAFAIFQINTDMPGPDVAVVDGPHWERELRDEYFVPGWTPIHVRRSPSSAPEEMEMRWTLEEAVNRFPWFCYANRFEPLFNRQYFIWVDHDKVQDEGVVLVRYDWDMNVERSEGDLWDLRELDAVKTMRVPAGEAMAKIQVAAKNGSDDWTWEAYKV